MTDRDLASFNAGLRHAADLARIAAITLEIRAAATEMRQRAAIEALRGLADGLRAEARVGDVETSPSAREAGATAPPIPSRDQALAAGYTGDACSSCGSFAMKRAGACLSCDACGTSSGCS